MLTLTRRRARPLLRILAAAVLTSALLCTAPAVRSASARVGGKRAVVTAPAWVWSRIQAPASRTHRSHRRQAHDPRRIRTRKIHAVLRAAREAIGTPYVYGGERLHGGFDCSGLVQWAWRHAGVNLPRTSYEMWPAVPHVGRHHLQPGDILFFYSGISHVALYVGHGRMIEAPHTGLRVRTIGVYWQYLVGAGRPRLLPLDRGRGLAGHVVHHAVHARHLRDDPARDALQHFVWETGPVGGHRIL
jgi:cell wall-associated NlpC family hydrolase